MNVDNTQFNQSSNQLGWMLFEAYLRSTLGNCHLSKQGNIHGN